MPSGFNEATAPLPWKYRRHHSAVREDVRSSMGPRPFSRGDSAPARYIAGRHRSFNGATAFQPWRHARGAVRPDTREVASMGPRPFSRGDARAVPLAARALQASMGPRPFSRGDSLYCGRCGRRAACFNGATAFQPWRQDRRAAPSLKRHCPPSSLLRTAPTPRTCIPRQRAWSSLRTGSMPGVSHGSRLTLSPHAVPGTPGSRPAPPMCPSEAGLTPSPRPSP